MAKQAKAKPAPKKTARKRPLQPTTKPKGESKYDQPGAPWWKKYRLSAIRM